MLPIVHYIQCTTIHTNELCQFNEITLASMRTVIWLVQCAWFHRCQL